jgi:acyl-CoA thioesterase
VAITENLHFFDAAVALAPIEDGVTDGVYTGHTHPAYANMVGPFGGIIAAALLNAVQLHPLRLGEPLSLTVHFAAPIADGAFTVEAKALRTNRSTQHWHVQLLQDGQVAAFATAVTAIRRDTWQALDTPLPAAPPAATISPMAPIAFVPWSANYEMRFVSGMPGAPGSASDSSASLLWLRDLPERPLDFLSLAALCDAFFARIYVRRPQLVPIGTVAMTIYFHTDGAQLAELPSAPVLGSASASSFRKGYHDQSVGIWSASGALLATSTQIVYFKE